jgi:urocanate hydratase
MRFGAGVHAGIADLRTYHAYRYRPAGRIYGKDIDSYRGCCIEVKLFKS